MNSTLHITEEISELENIVEILSKMQQHTYTQKTNEKREQSITEL